MKITDSDRECFASLYDAAEVRAGMYDETPLMKAFARARLAAYEEAAQTAEHYPSMEGADIKVVRSIAYAIRKLGNM